jgi:predicted CopG family antitoxin
MNSQEWEEVEQEVIKFLNSINLIQEMKQGREGLSDFMYRLEEKYPFKCYSAISLFDAFSEEDFKDYLYNRYKNIDCFTQEYTYTDIIRR